MQDKTIAELEQAADAAIKKLGDATLRETITRNQVKAARKEWRRATLALAQARLEAIPAATN